jgi:hypothetical protein
MKKLIAFAVLFFVSSSVHAQTSPRVISYQGFIASNGSPGDSGMFAISVALYSDSGGAACVWRDTYWTPVTNGVFNLALGSHVQLPSNRDMDGPLWLGVSVNGGAEARPLSQLSTSPFAINVADSSITAKKMATDYVSAVTVNGTKITSQGSALNLSSEGIVKFQFDSSSNSVIATMPIAPIANGDGGTDWSETGNNSTTPGINYVGTSDSVALEIHVNDGGDTMAGNGRVMRYEPMGKSPNIIGGYRGNYITSSDSGGNVIAGGGNFTVPNSVAGNYATVGGGLGNLAYTGGTVAGGGSNFADEFATVSGGTANGANQASVVGGGVGNQIYTFYSTIVGGLGNTINEGVVGSVHLAGLYSNIAGGIDNNIYGPGSAIPGGGNLNLGQFSFGYNGDSSLYSAHRVTDISLLQGVAYFGNVNMMIGNVDSVARQLQLFGPNTDLSYGSGAKYTAFRAPLMDTSVLYTLPKADGAVSTVLTEDGHGNLSWENQLGASGWSITGNLGTSPPMNFIGTLDTGAFEIHLDNLSTDTFAGNHRVMRYETGTSSPNILGGSSHNFLISGLSGAAILSGGSASYPNIIRSDFSVVGGGEVNLIDTASTHSIIGGGYYNYIGASYCFIGGGGGPADGGPSISPAVSADLTESMSRTSTSRFSDIHEGPTYSNRAMSPWTVIGGGYDNIVYDTLASILGGAFNTASGYASSISGGVYHFNFSNFAVIGGGNTNMIDLFSDNSTIGGGIVNYIASSASTIGGGSNNNILDSNATIAGGYLNFIDLGSPYAFVGGGNSNYILGLSAVIAGGDSNSITNNSPYAGILSGKHNLIQDTGAIIAGGDSNNVFASYSMVGAGQHNKIDSSSNYSIIAEGSSNTIIASQNAAIVGGANNSIDSNSTYSGILAGQDNILKGDHNMIGAGEANIINGSWLFIGSGQNDTLTGENSGIGAGYLSSVTAAWSFLGSGEVNKIVGVGFSFMGSGQFNYIGAEFDFIGAGNQNSIFSGSSGIGAGNNNTIGVTSEWSFISAGYGNMALATNSFIGSGTGNITDTGAMFEVGSYASIPGGQGLRTQSYAQTAMGFYNAHAGSTLNDTEAHTTAHMDDPLVIVGNGIPDSSYSTYVGDSLVLVTVPRGSDAALISNGGHLLVFDQLGNATTSHVRNDPIIGGAYKDNMINAWGDVQGTVHGSPEHYVATNDFGDIADTAIAIKHSALGTYTITIQCYNSDGSPRFLSAAAINVTIQQNEGESCGYATVSKIAGNAFTVHTYSGANPADPGACNAADRSFFFTVVGR